nr:amyotrophic lateral sclerosis 2 chromosomal region candidate gene 12 protein [Meriones unguiculatus]
MYPNPLIYCTCWDPWNLGPRKLIKTPHPLPKTAPKKPKTERFGPMRHHHAVSIEVIDVSPGYKLIRSREQISVTLGDEMFNRKKRLESDILNKVKYSRADIISDLEEQISELTAIIEQMNTEHQASQKVLSNEMEQRCAELKEKFENENRDLKKSHKMELEKLEDSYKEALKAEKVASQEKLEELSKEYKYLKNMFHMYQDSIYDEMEDKWLKRKAEWERDERLEREKILLQQKHRITKKFELESVEEKRRMNESLSAIYDNFNREKEELMKKHNEDMLEIQELKKSKEIMEAELRAQSIILETLNTNFYQIQMELHREKTIAGNLERLFQAKLAEAEEKYKHTIQLLTEENARLRQKLKTKNEETSEETPEKLACITFSVQEWDPPVGSNKKPVS